MSDELELVGSREPEDWNNPEWRAKIRGCLTAGPGRGDCMHFIGLPPNYAWQDNTDEYGIPLGWCIVCWHHYKLSVAQLDGPDSSDSPEIDAARWRWLEHHLEQHLEMGYISEAVRVARRQLIEAIHDMHADRRMRMDPSISRDLAVAWQGYEATLLEEGYRRIESGRVVLLAP